MLTKNNIKGRLDWVICMQNQLVAYVWLLQGLSRYYMGTASKR